MANEILGYMRMSCADCGEKPSIMQAKRKGAHLYTRCDCGLDQRTGKAFQGRIWLGADWLGHAPTPPACIDVEKLESQREIATEPEADFEPTVLVESRSEAKPKKGKARRGVGVVILVGLGVAGIAAIAGA